MCNEKGNTLGRKAPPRRAARRVELKVEEVVGGSQVAKPYGVDALANHISKVLKN
jgi:hypothetical protein